MKTFNTKALVLREYETGESDKRLVLLGKDCGKITVYARGAKKPKSKFLAPSQLFTYGDFVIAEGRGFYSLNRAAVIESFFAVREDYDALCCGQYMLEICALLPGGTPANELLLSLLKALQFLAGTKIPKIQALVVFMFRFYRFYGLTPSTDCCSCARSQADAADGHIAPHQPRTAKNNEVVFCREGIICETCVEYHSNDYVMPLSVGAAAAIRHIINTPDKSEARAYSFAVSDAILAEIYEAAKLYWLGHFDILPKSHSLLDL